MDDAQRFLVTTKSNGENGKYTFRRIFGDWYCSSAVSSLFCLPHTPFFYFSAAQSAGRFLHKCTACTSSTPAPDSLVPEAFRSLSFRHVKSMYKPPGIRNILECHRKSSL